MAVPRNRRHVRTPGLVIMNPALVKVTAVLDTAGVKIAEKLGTMWAAVMFACLTCVSLPTVIASHDVVMIVQWVGSVFLQLVFLPIIMVGQSVQGERTEARDRETHDAVMAEHTEIKQILNAMNLPGVNTE